MEYYSVIKKNTFESVLMRWMKLELIIQSEVSQKEKHQYGILTHIPCVFNDSYSDRSSGLVFPSLSEFSTVDCDPHSQRH